jgi:PHD/YefM family antitoxin component YafN of YafNO toxin-antitoxin module
MSMVSRFVGAEELCKRSGTLLLNVTETGEPCYITQDGKAQAVIMDINRYNALMDLVEEAEHPELIPAEPANTISVRTILAQSSRSSAPKRS